MGAASGLDLEATQQALDRLVATGVLVRDAELGAHSFRHSLIRDAIYASLLHADRSTHAHRAVAEGLEQLGVSVDRPAEVHAYHLAEGGDRLGAAERFAAAALVAARRGACEECRVLCSRGLDLIRHWPDRAVAAPIELELTMTLGNATNALLWEETEPARSLLKEAQAVAGTYGLPFYEHTAELLGAGADALEGDSTALDLAVRAADRAPRRRGRCRHLGRLVGHGARTGGSRSPGPGPRHRRGGHRGDSCLRGTDTRRRAPPRRRAHRPRLRAAHARGRPGHGCPPSQKWAAGRGMFLQAWRARTRCRRPGRRGQRSQPSLDQQWQPVRKLSDVPDAMRAAISGLPARPYSYRPPPYLAEAAKLGAFVEQNLSPLKVALVQAAREDITKALAALAPDLDTPIDQRSVRKFLEDLLAGRLRVPAQVPQPSAPMARSSRWPVWLPRPRRTSRGGPRPTP